MTLEESCGLLCRDWERHPLDSFGTGDFIGVLQEVLWTPIQRLGEGRDWERNPVDFIETGDCGGGGLWTPMQRLHGRGVLQTPLTPQGPVFSISFHWGGMPKHHIGRHVGNRTNRTSKE